MEGNAAESTLAYILAIAFAPNLGRLTFRLGGVADVLSCAHDATQISARLVQPGDQLDASGRAQPGSFPAGSCTKNSTAGLRGCAMVEEAPQLVSTSAGVSIDISIVFGGSVDLGGSHTNTALVILQCKAAGSLGTQWI